MCAGAYESSRCGECPAHVYASGLLAVGALKQLASADVLSTPALPVPLVAPDVVHEIFEAGIGTPPGGTKLPSAFTLMRNEL